ncbi:MAG: NAD(P)-dependent oxidoreductase [Alphaproteobacteria bacterium]
MAGDKLIVYPDAEADMTGMLAGERLVRLEKHGRFVAHQGRPADNAQYVERIKGASGILLGWDLPTDVMTQAPDLEVIVFAGIGVGTFVELDVAVAQGITVCNTPGYADNAVAEHALALLLSLARHTPRLDAKLRAGEWDQSHTGFELRGKTLGVVGFGGIGARMAEIGKALGMDVVAWTRNASPERAARHGVTFTALDDLLAASDVVSLHVPANAETEGLLGAAQLDRMKPGAVLVNTARAQVVDEAAMIERLQSGRLGGAALDVYGEEPLAADHPLIALDNVVLSPHMGFGTPEAITAILDIAIDGLAGYFDGDPVNVVAAPEC